MNTAVEITNKECCECSFPLTANSSFCGQCGMVKPVAETSLTELKWHLLKQVGLFYAIDLGICMVYKFADQLHTLVGLSLFYVITALITLFFLSLNSSESLQLLQWKSFHIGKVWFLFSAAIIASVGVSSSVGWLNRIIFPHTVFYNEIFAGHAHKYGLMILFIAVLPAVLEELAYRGYILQQLLKVVDSRQAVYITSFLFAIAHLSFLSLFWLIPFSLLLGYIRVKNNTLWYGIGIHFFFNLTACLIDFI